MGFRIGLLYTRFASMPQALWTALREDGHDVIRPEDLEIRTPMSSEDMTRFARLTAPDVILCPFLKEVVPPEVCERTTTWIPHPGIRGRLGCPVHRWPRRRRRAARSRRACTRPGRTCRCPGRHLPPRRSDGRGSVACRRQTPTRRARGHPATCQPGRAASPLSLPRRWPRSPASRGRRTAPGTWRTRRSGRLRAPSRRTRPRPLRRSPAPRSPWPAASAGSPWARGPGRL